MIRKQVVLKNLRPTVIFLLFLTFCNSELHANQCEDLLKKFESDIIIKDLNSNTNYADYLEKLKKTEKSLSLVFTECPDNLNLRVLMANAKSRLGKDDEALLYAKEAISIDSSNAKANYMMGTLLFFSDKREEGLEYIARSIDFAPDNINYLVNYCSLLVSAAKYQDAIEVCTIAIENEELNGKLKGQVLSNRADAYNAIGKTQKAEADLAEAKEYGW